MADVQKRARLFANMQRSKTYVDSEDLNQATIGDLDARISHLTATYQKALDEQFEIVAVTVENEDKLEQERLFDVAEADYLYTLGKLNDKKRQLESVDLESRNAALESMIRNSVQEFLPNRSSIQQQPASTPISENIPLIPAASASQQNVLPVPPANEPLELPPAIEPAGNNVSNQPQFIVSIPATCPIVGSSNISANISTNSGANVPQNLVRSGFKLKDQDLPKFNGDLDRWLSFRYIFVPYVHNNAQYPPLTKFTILYNNREIIMQRLGNCCVTHMKIKN